MACGSDFLVALQAPERLGLAALPHVPAAEHVEGVREAVQVANGFGFDLLDARQRDDTALGAAANRSREVQVGGGPAAAREGEAAERRELGVELVDVTLERLDVSRFDSRLCVAQFAGQRGQE